MQKPAFFSAFSKASPPAMPGLSGAEPSGFQHSTSGPLTTERLDHFGARWLQALPVTIRPLITAKRHPHVVNKFAILWGDDEAVDAYFADLLICSRPGRRGFATEVLDELVDLQRALHEKRRF
jgi:hypothetical protein